MNALEFVKHYNTEKGYGTSPEELLQTLQECGECVSSERICQHRWYDSYFYVVKLERMLLGYHWFETTGDLTPEDQGLEFDPDSICYVKREEKVTFLYIAIDEPKEIEPKGPKNID